MKMSKTGIPLADGCTITAEDLKKDKSFNICDFGAKPDGDPVSNTTAINKAIEAATEAGGGDVVFPEGDFKTYTVRLKSNVNIYLSEGAILHAARTDIKNSYDKQVGEGGNYDEPEINLYAGLQDHGHSYFANSLIYGADISNVMIYGKGLIDGSYIDEDGFRKYVLQGGDPFENPSRAANGHKGEWFGNKGIALVRCNNIVLKDFSLLIGGHFAIIAEGVVNMLTDGVLIDTTRDAFDIDCCQDVTVVNSTFNSLTDDALVMKASYGAGVFMPLKNVLIHDCVVSGYDAGSVYAKTYTADKLVATDRCGPTARVKLGTESTCGYDRVTVSRVKFMRSRGFALEAVDGSDLSNIVFTDSEMEDVSSSPIYLKIGDRGRFPVTGNSPEDKLIADETNVRLDNRNWVLPNTDKYTEYPARRYTPAYNKTAKVCIDGHTEISIVDAENPVKLNPANYHEENGRYYLKTFNSKTKNYEPDYDKEIPKSMLGAYGNANGSEKIAGLYNVEISNIKAKNVDPRYPIMLMGLMDSHIKNVSISDIEVEYRGGILMEHAVEQRQLNTNWEYTQFETKAAIQTLPWLVNPFFAKEEALLPRVEWDADRKVWKNSPYNIPEMPCVYPEPSNYGIVPAYGLYARHVDGLKLKNIKFTLMIADERPAMVLDDVHGVKLLEPDMENLIGMPDVVLVKNMYKRPTHLEYLKEYPYQTTEVTDFYTDDKFITVQEVTVNAPAPGTPSDSLYPYPTVATSETGYSFSKKTENYPIPKTVYRPFFMPIGTACVEKGTEVTIMPRLRIPYSETAQKAAEGHIYNEVIKKLDYVVEGQKLGGRMSVETELPATAYKFDAKTGVFVWNAMESGDYTIRFIYDDGLIPVCSECKITVR